MGPKLGSGNFATVYKATSRNTGVVYAVKEVKKNEAFNAKVEASLEREIGILMSIDHVRFSIWDVVYLFSIFFFWKHSFVFDERVIC